MTWTAWFVFILIDQLLLSNTILAVLGPGLIMWNEFIVGYKFSKTQDIVREESNIFPKFLFIIFVNFWQELMEVFLISVLEGVVIILRV